MSIVCTYCGLVGHQNMSTDHAECVDALMKANRYLMGVITRKTIEIKRLNEAIQLLREQIVARSQRYGLLV